ncbi:MAG: PAS domain S-box protein [Nitrosarchaeum sp.]|nr:PAS domain S-box protein [Nitrosarchaeum sp.]
MELYTEELAKIRQLLKAHPRGMTITELSAELQTNRNSVAKYLEILLISGSAEMRQTGPAKIYYLSHRVPISAMADFSTDLILAFDEQSQCIQANERALHFFERAREDLIGRDAQELLGEHVKHLHTEEQTRTNITLHEKILDARFIPTTLADGSLGTTIIAEDITEKQAHAERLRLFERAIESSVNGITIADATDPEMPLIYINKAFEKITGYSREEVVGRNCRFLQADQRDQDVVKKIRHALEHGEEGYFVLRNFRKDGTEFLNELHLAPVKDSSGTVTHYVGVQNVLPNPKHQQLNERKT